MLTRLGKYEIQSEIGQGAFGRVYRAYDPEMRRDVAIKLLIAEDPEMLDRFRNEAGTTGKLQHKNIVTVHEYSAEQGKPYIVMELLDGQNLQQIIAAGAALPLLVKAQIAFQTAEGLAVAHKKGIIHRDIKPANVMLLPSGDVKIMDFGIARVITTDTRRTRKGDVIGTILYMAPERIQEAEADAASDV